MTDNLIIKTASAYAYPLLIRNLFLAPIAENPEQVTGITDEKWGERPLALVIVKADTQEPDPKELVNHVKAFIDKGLMSKLAVLAQIRYVSAIDKTSGGKINNKLLREKHLN